MKIINDEFDRADGIEVKKNVQHNEYIRVFDDFYERNRSQADVVAAKIEAETAHLIDSYVTRLDPSFARLMGDYMAKETD